MTTYFVKVKILCPHNWNMPDETAFLVDVEDPCARTIEETVAREFHMRREDWRITDIVKL